MSLKRTLDAIREKGLTSIPQAALEIMHGATAQLERSGQAERALGVGDAAPAFELPDSTGSPVSTAALLADGPLVVSFYRGKW